MKYSNKGFTLVEMIVVMAVFMFIIIITGDTFKTIITHVSRLTKSEESSAEGHVGMEMFRHDLQQAGFGLPYSYIDPISPPTYSEADAAIHASSYNDATSASRIPRALAFGENLAASTGMLANTDYIAIKGTSLGAPSTTSRTPQKWTYMPYSSGITGKQKPRIWQSDRLTHGSDRVIVIKRAFNGTTYVNQMIYNPTSPTIYWATYYDDGFADTVFNPTLYEETYYLYGITQDDPLGMPFNRTDYYVAIPATASNLPTYCAPKTGILYKGVVNHTNGRLQPIPLMDCVADMQVVLGWDLTDSAGQTTQDGVVETYSNADGTAVSGTATQAMVTAALADPEILRNSLKVVKVYILAQVGRKEPNFTSQASFVVGGVGESALTKTYNIGTDMRNFRWKVYQLIVRPKNLLSNQ